MKKYLTFILAILLSANIFAQGTLMLVGGGTERTGTDAWNYNPYTKAVDLAANKKVAIIAWGAEPDSWLRDYFTETCEALRAVHFDFSSISTDNYQDYYDSLMNYDMLFFKGGDQFNYYNNFKNTPIATAITDKYNEGGVISGTSAGTAIQSSVVYTAENGTVYPDEAINNPLNQYMTLANDFCDLMPGYVFDTHFAERGRFPRLAGLLANWYYSQEERITGLGVDDLTAMIIRNDSVYAYGTGAGNFYDISSATFDQSETNLVAENIKVMQLLNNCTYDVNTGNIEGFENTSEPALEMENRAYTLLMSGANTGTAYTNMMSTLVNDCGNVSDNIVIIAPESSTTVANLTTAIEAETNATVHHFAPTTANGSDATFSNVITNNRKFVFVDNDYNTLMNFIDGTDNGQQLDAKMRAYISITAFVGDNSRFAGTTVVEDYLTPGNSYYGDLTFEPGLGLLKTTVVMPNTFKENDIFENTTTAVPYAMLTDDLTYGIWLNKNNYVKYHAANDTAWLQAYGNSPVMALKNEGTPYGFSVTPNVGDYTPRMVAGFEEMTLSIFNASSPYIMGTEPGLGLENSIDKLRGLVYPNPAKDKVFCDYEALTELTILSLDGKIIKRFSGQKRYEINIADFSSGIYLFKAAGNKKSVTNKISITH